MTSKIQTSESDLDLSNQKKKKSRAIRNLLLYFVVYLFFGYLIGDQFGLSLQETMIFLIAAFLIILIFSLIINLKAAGKTKNVAAYEEMKKIREKKKTEEEEKIKERIRKIEQKNLELSQKIAQLKEYSKQEITQEIKRVENEKAKIKNELDESINQIEKEIYKEKNTYEQIQKQLKKEMQNSQYTKKELDAKKTYMEEELKKKSQEILEKQKMLQKRKEEIQNIRKEYEIKLNIELSSLNSTLEQKRKELEEQKQLELKKLQKQLEEEQERIQIMMKKKELEEAKKRLQQEYEQKQIEPLENAIKTVETLTTELEQKLKNIPQNISNQYNEEIARIRALMSTIKVDLNTQKQKYEDRKMLVESLRLINTQIKKLKESMSSQRACPTLMVQNNIQGKAFTKITTIDFLCEACYKPVASAEIQEVKPWVKYSILGFKVLLSFVAIKGFDAILANLPIPNFNLDKIGEIIDEKVGSCCERLGEYWDQINNIEELKDSFTTVADKQREEIISRFMMECGSEKKKIKDSILLSHLFYEYLIREKKTSQVLEYLQNQEKNIWIWFSREDQENLRSMLKNTGNAHIFNSAFNLKNGLYICDECAQWIEEQEKTENIY